MGFAFGIARRAFGSSGKVLARRPASVAMWIGLIALATSCCQGCLVLPVRVPTRTNGPSGAMDKVNLDFIEAGKTTREEVTQKLGGTDTAVKDDRIFLGRWASSKWGVLWAVGAQTGGTGGWNRGWARHNVLIAFDEKGVVQQFQKFPDEELVKQLSAWVAQGQGQPLDLSVPIEVPVEHRHASGRTLSGTLVLGNDSFEFRENDNEKHNFKILPAQINELRLTSVGHGDKSDPRFMNQTIHFTEKTNVGRKMTIRVDVPTVMTLVKYLAQTRSRKPAGGTGF
jgi:hypothetical protein